MNDLRALPAAIGVIVIALLFAGVVFAIYPGWPFIGKFLINNIKLSENAPAWVQAIGSILAILVAVAISFWDKYTTTKTNEENDKRIGIIVSWELVTNLESMIGFFGSIKSSIEKSEGVDKKYDGIKLCKYLIGTVIVPTDVQIIRVSKISNDAALLLAQLSSNIKKIQHYFSFTVGMNGVDSISHKQFMVDYVEKDLKKIIDLIRDSQSLLIDFLEKNGQKTGL